MYNVPVNPFCGLLYQKNVLQWRLYVCFFIFLLFLSFKSPLDYHKMSRYELLFFSLAFRFLCVSFFLCLLLPFSVCRFASPSLHRDFAARSPEIGHDQMKCFADRRKVTLRNLCGVTVNCKSRAFAVGV